MNRLIVFFFCIFSVLASVSAQNVNPYWTELKGPDGGSAENLFVTNDSVCYNYNKKVVYRSTDMGLHWNRLNISPEGLGGDFFIGASGKFYFTKYTFGKYALKCSSDLGATWALVNANIPSRYILETRAGSLIAYTATAIYRSVDGGLNWALVSSVGAQTLTEWKPGLLMDWKDNSNNNKNGILSTDDGATWNSFNNGQLQFGFQSIGVMSKDTFFAGGYPDGNFSNQYFYRSFDRGITWDSISMGDWKLQSQPILILPTGRILTTGAKMNQYAQVICSDDLGLTWKPAPTTTEVRPVSLLLILPNGDIIGRRGYGYIGSSFLRSSDGGVNWSLSSKGIDLTTCRHIEFVGDSMILALTNDGLAGTMNRGGQWSYLLTSRDGVDPGYPNLSALNMDTFIVTIDGRLRLTLNGGNTFVDINPSISAIPAEKCFIDPKTKRIIYSTFYDQYVSDDLGVTWVRNPAALKLIVAHPSGKLFGVDIKGSRKIFISSDHANTWQDVTPNLFTAEKLFISANGHICAFGAQNGAAMVAVSQDEGNSWELNQIPGNSTGIFVNALGVNALGHIYIGKIGAWTQMAFICSTDKGASWFELPYLSKSYYTLDRIMTTSPDGYLYFAGGDASDDFRYYRSTSSTLLGGYVRGQVRKDGDADCSTPDAQDPLRWPVKIDGQQDFYALPSVQGKYEVFVPALGAYQVSVREPNSVWWDFCDSTQTIHLDTLFAVDTASFSGRALMECPLMQVDVVAPRLRRCFDNSVYVQYCNIGTEPADSAWVEIELDPYLTLISAELPYDSLGANRFRFNLGPVLTEACGQFHFVVHVDCDSAIIGQTHCITAHAWPDTLCGPVNGWSGANIEAEAHCLGDSIVQLILKNTGTGVSQQLEYIIIEDQVVLDMGNNSYDPGEEITLEMPAQGRTWRIESQQEPGHPFSALAIAFTEGCDGFNSLGFINQFSVNGIQPAWNRFCLENTGSYDPNDKQGFPLGYGADRRIRPGQDLDYLIRFQNTGTDTAFTVVIRDSLSAWLDPTSVRPGAASHPYTWELNGQGVLSFKFANILLPDSTTNLAGSQGFISFSVAQQPQVPLGTKIRNEAYIYFDFNEPVVTNKTLHTVGLPQVSGIKNPSTATTRPSAVLVAPNPVLESAVFRLNEGSFHHHLLTLTDALGRTVRQSPMMGSECVFERKNLPAGVYLYRVEDSQGRLTGSGCLVLE